MKKFFFITCIIVTFSSCSKKTESIDGTSQQNFQKSITQLSSNLNTLKQDRFQDAIKIIYRYVAKGETEEEKTKNLYRGLNGKSVNQIFKLAEKTAKKEKIAWNRNSLKGLPSSFFETSLQQQINAGNYSQIDNAKKVLIKFNVYEFGYYFSLSLVDDQNKSIIFEEIPMNLSFNLYNSNNQLIYTENKEIKNVRELDDGVKIFYSSFKGKILTSTAIAKVIIKAQNKILKGDLEDIPIDYNRVKQDIFEEQIADEIALNNVRTFFKTLEKHNYNKSIEYITGQMWIDHKNEFMSDEEMNILEFNLLKSDDKNEKKVIALYQKKKEENVRRIKQEFTLQYYHQDWIITNVRIIENKLDIWKEE